MRAHDTVRMTMALDTSPAESARSLLNGIDYSALIGGPLQAAITAQAMAAKSTWEFIQQVGLNTDPDGNRSVINVTFLYQRDGQMARLIVPILTIVPIPLIVVDEISIDFTANINASASSTTENASSQDVGGELTAEGKIGWGPFSLSARLKASYSSKQSSKATQDSRYSVEYTQNVAVHATQADMPAGLAAVLNLLSSATTGGTTNGELTISPELVTVDESITTVAEPGAQQIIQVRTRDGNGRDVSTDVTVSVPAEFEGCFQFWEFPSGNKIGWTDNRFIRRTNATGVLSLWLTATAKKAPLPPPFPVLTLSATVKDSQLETFLVTSIVRALPSPITVTPSPLELPEGMAEETIRVSSTTVDAPEGIVNVSSSAGSNTKLTFPTTIILDGTGTATAKIKWVDDGNHPAETLTFELGAIRTSLVVIQPRTLASARRSSASMHFRAAQEASATPGLNVIPGPTTQSWTIVMQDLEDAGGRQPVTIRFDPAAIAVRHEGRKLANGEAFRLDNRNTARLEFEAVQGSGARATEVALESALDGGRMRKVIPVQID